MCVRFTVAISNLGKRFTWPEGAGLPASSIRTKCENMVCHFSWFPYTVPAPWYRYNWQGFIQTSACQVDVCCQSQTPSGCYSEYANSVQGAGLGYDMRRDANDINEIMLASYRFSAWVCLEIFFLADSSAIILQRKREASIRMCNVKVHLPMQLTRDHGLSTNTFTHSFQLWPGMAVMNRTAFSRLLRQLLVWNAPEVPAGLGQDVACVCRANFPVGLKPLVGGKNIKLRRKIASFPFVSVYIYMYDVGIRHSQTTHGCIMIIF